MLPVDTIAAISTAQGPAGIAIVRVSGSGAFSIAAKVAGAKAIAAATGHDAHFPCAHFAHFRNPATGTVVDEGVLLLFKAPHSYTGEDVAEFQGHGGRLPSSSLLAAIIAAGARQANAGEFTQRAFLNGKIDLVRAEAVMDFIGAASARAAASAREQLSGALSAKLSAIYSAVISVESDVEHLLDFDEGEIDDSFYQSAHFRVVSTLHDVESLLATWRTGSLLRDGAMVVICGRPNAGKSSLMNALLGRNRAIVSPQAGTTRDSIEEPFSIHGIPVRLVDTAGLRIASGDIEAEGIARAKALIERADVAIEVIDAANPDAAALATAALAGNRIPALNKIDTIPSNSDVLHIPGIIPISAKNGDGLNSLIDAVALKLDAAPAEESEIAVSERHRQCLDLAHRHLEDASLALSMPDGSRLVEAASSLAIAAQSIGAITGKSWSNDLLDSIFGKFCVGK